MFENYGGLKKSRFGNSQISVLLAYRPVTKLYQESEDGSEIIIINTVSSPRRPLGNVRAFPPNVVKTKRN